MTTKNTTVGKMLHTFPYIVDPKTLAPKDWTRTYPANMRIDDEHDHLAVASGAQARYARCPEVFTQVNGCWKEVLSGLSFDEVDIAYLDYLLGACGPHTDLHRRLSDYARSAGKARWQGPPRMQVKEVGWMYFNLETYLAYQLRRGEYDNIDSDLVKSGFAADLDETPQDFWYEGAQWYTESLDWIPPAHEAMRILARVKSRAKSKGPQAGYAKVPSGELNSPLVGKVRWHAAIQIVAPNGKPTLELPGQWIPQTTPEGVDFVDRHAWDSLIYAAEKTRELYTRILELGSDLIPAGDDTELGPVAWIAQQVANLREYLPARWISEKVPAMMAMCEMTWQIGEACLKESFRMEEPVADPFENLDLIEMAKVLRQMFPRKRTPKVRIRRRQERRKLKLSGERILVDYASAQW